MRDFDTLRDFLVKKMGPVATAGVLDDGDITEAIYFYVMIFCSFYIAKISSKKQISRDELQKLYRTDHMEQNLAWQICWLLKAEHKHITMDDFYGTAYILLGLELPKDFANYPFAGRRVIDLLCTEKMFELYVYANKKLKQKIEPDNAIDRFFYKTGRSIKNTKNTVEESEVMTKLMPTLIWIIIIAIITTVLSILNN